jgi:hypothetical protein
VWQLKIDLVLTIAIARQRSTDINPNILIHHILIDQRWGFALAIWASTILQTQQLIQPSNPPTNHAIIQPSNPPTVQSSKKRPPPIEAAQTH